jgi:hypothetical protein
LSPVGEAALSAFGLQIVIAITVMIAAIVTAVVLHRQASIRRDHAEFETETETHVRHSDLERGLAIVRSDFQQSLETAHAAVQSAAKRTEHVMVVVERIELAFGDLQNRIVELQQRADASALAEMKSSSAPDGQVPQARARIIDYDRPEAHDQRMRAVPDVLSKPAQAIEGMTLRQGESAAIAAVEDRLAGIQRQMDDLVERFDRGEKRRADLSTLTSELADAITSLRVSSVETAQRVADLERLFLSKADGAQARQSPHPGSLHLSTDITDAIATAARDEASTPAVEGDRAIGTPQLPDAFAPPVQDVISVAHAGRDGGPQVAREPEDRVESPASPPLQYFPAKARPGPYPGWIAVRRKKMRPRKEFRLRKGAERRRRKIRVAATPIARGRSADDGPVCANRLTQKHDSDSFGAKKMKPKKALSQTWKRPGYPAHFPAKARRRVDLGRMPLKKARLRKGALASSSSGRTDHDLEHVPAKARPLLDVDRMPIRPRKMQPIKDSKAWSQSKLKHALMRRRRSFTRKLQIASRRPDFPDRGVRGRAFDDADASGNGLPGAPHDR